MTEIKIIKNKTRVPCFTFLILCGREGIKLQYRPKLSKKPTVHMQWRRPIKIKNAVKSCA
jgi:hypothetical protein